MFKQSLDPFNLNSHIIHFFHQMPNHEKDIYILYEIIYSIQDLNFTYPPIPKLAPKCGQYAATA